MSLHKISAPTLQAALGALPPGAAPESDPTCNLGPQVFTYTALIPPIALSRRRYSNFTDTRYPKAIAAAKELFCKMGAKATNLVAKGACCKQLNCNLMFNAKQIVQLQVLLSQRIGDSKVKRKEWIRSKIHDSRVLRSSDFKLQKARFSIAGRSICREMFTRIYSIGHSVYDQLCAEVSEGLIVGTLEQKKRDQVVTLSTSILHTFQDGVASHCEVMPMGCVVGDEMGLLFDVDCKSEMLHNEKRYFPACYTWTSMHGMYKSHVEANFSHVLDSISICEYDHFRKTFQARYPNISLLDPNATLFKCATCSKLRTALNSTIDPAERKLLEFHIKAHSHHFKRARQVRTPMECGHNRVWTPYCCIVI